MDTFIAAIDKSNITGAVYGVGRTTAEALVQCDIEHDDGCEADCDPAEHYGWVECTPAAAAYIETHGGAPSRELLVCEHDGVMLRSEET
jgi:hypothetical protein